MAKSEVAAKRGRVNRRKGHDYERLIVRVLKDLGWTKAMSTRACSKLLDDCKIDIAPNGPVTDNLDFLIQCKAGYIKQRPKADVEFRKMLEGLSEYFPSDHTIFKAKKFLMHKFGRKDEEHLVTMTFKDWVAIMQELVSLREKHVEQEKPDNN
jgi:Holliday junction resolvase|tara:strand:- start:1551 stop:2009 length:459 start_codon:yes stop_codon:yes gene_type:complete